MKSLLESILSSTNTGIKSMIDKWCKEHNIYKGYYEITSDLKIRRTEPILSLLLFYNDYDELPDYIEFEGDESLQVRIVADNKIKSFRGIPDKCFYCALAIKPVCALPELSIKVVAGFEARGFIRKFDKLDVEYIGKPTLSNGQLRKAVLNIDSWDNVWIDGANVISFVNDFNMGNKFSKAMIRKAEMNKYRNKYDTPVTPEGEKVIEDMLGEYINIKKLTEIDYTQNSRLVKYKNKWYRCKNW